MTAITAPSAAHPHLPDQACDHLCQATAPATARVIRQPAPARPAITARQARRPWILAGAGALVSILLGIFLIVWGTTHHQTWYDSFYSEWHSPPLYADIVWGVVLVLAPFVIAIIAVICAAISQAAEVHRQWLSQFTPEQQKRIRAAEQTAVAVGAYALHRHMRTQNRAASARLSASVIGQQWQPGGPPPAALRQSWQGTHDFGPVPNQGPASARLSQNW